MPAHAPGENAMTVPRAGLLAALLLSALPMAAHAAEPPAYDAALAAKFGADERGMRAYVQVILKTGPKPIPAGPERDAMFRGHFANMQRLSDEGKLVLA